jgi:predicted esterase/Tfp pilus assembly protein PilF
MNPLNHFIRPQRFFAIPLALILAATTMLSSADAKDDDRPARILALDGQLHDHYEVGEYEKAIECGLKILELDPSDAGTLYNLGCLYALTGEQDKAYEYLEKAIEHGFRDREHFAADPDLRSLHDQERYKSLLQKLDVATTPDPERPTSAEDAQREVLRLTQQLIQAAEKGDNEKALALARQAVEVAPDAPLTHYNLACMYARLERSGPAQDHLKRAIELGFRDVRHIESDSDLDNIRETPEYKTIIRELKQKSGEEAAEAMPALRYHVTLPIDHNPDKPAPLLVALHHWGGNLRMATEHWEDAADIVGAILVTPQGPVSTEEDRFRWDDSPDALDAILAVIDAVEKDYTIDKERIAVAGYSQGGQAAYLLLARHADRFCGAVSVAGLFDEHGEAAAKSAKLSGRRVYVMIGEDDPEDPELKSNRTAEASFTKSGAEVVFRTYPEAGHDFPKQRVREQVRALRYVLRLE